jgi:hypothetical protein
MKNQITEHSKKLRAETANNWQQKKIAEGGYRFTVVLTNKEIAEFARKEIPNKSEFLNNILKKLMAEKQTA